MCLRRAAGLRVEVAGVCVKPYLLSLCFVELNSFDFVVVLVEKAGQL